MKPEEINALYEKGLWSATIDGLAARERFACELGIAWPHVYRELMAARALRHRALNGDDHAEVSALMDEYDAARLETDK